MAISINSSTNPKKVTFNNNDVDYILKDGNGVWAKKNRLAINLTGKENIDSYLNNVKLERTVACKEPTVKTMVIHDGNDWLGDPYTYGLADYDAYCGDELKLTINLSDRYNIRGDQEPMYFEGYNAQVRNHVYDGIVVRSRVSPINLSPKIKTGYLISHKNLYTTAKGGQCHVSPSNLYNYGTNGNASQSFYDGVDYVVCPGDKYEIKLTILDGDYSYFKINGQTGSGGVPNSKYTLTGYASGNGEVITNTENIASNVYLLPFVPNPGTMVSNVRKGDSGRNHWVSATLTNSSDFSVQYQVEGGSGGSIAPHGGTKEISRTSAISIDTITFEVWSDEHNLNRKSYTAHAY